jgi:transcriptional regulator with XRE-family HTH domain
MAKRKVRVQHAEVVKLFATRLRELRHSRGMTQAELAQRAHVTTSYVGRLESAGAAPGIDLVERLASALGSSLADLLPTTPPLDPLAVLRERAKQLFEDLLRVADRETLLMLNPLLARLTEAAIRNR